MDRPLFPSSMFVRFTCSACRRSRASARHPLAEQQAIALRVAGCHLPEQRASLPLIACPHPAFVACQRSPRGLRMSGQPACPPNKFVRDTSFSILLLYCIYLGAAAIDRIDRQGDTRKAPRYHKLECVRIDRSTSLLAIEPSNHRACSPTCKPCLMP